MFAFEVIGSSDVGGGREESQSGMVAEIRVTFLGEITNIFSTT
jgi:hypothetical protein